MSYNEIRSSNQIILHLETVAGVAVDKSSNSNIIWTLLGTDNLSPFGNVKHLLSSKTLFKLSM